MNHRPTPQRVHTWIKNYPHRPTPKPNYWALIDKPRKRALIGFVIAMLWMVIVILMVENV